MGTWFESLYWRLHFSLSIGTLVSPAIFLHLSGKCAHLSWRAFHWLVAALGIAYFPNLMKYVTLMACQAEHFVLWQTLSCRREQVESHAAFPVFCFHLLSVTAKMEMMKKRWTVVTMWSEKRSGMATATLEKKENGNTHGSRVWAFLGWTVSLALLNSVSGKGCALVHSSRPHWQRQPVSTTTLPLPSHLRSSAKCSMVQGWWWGDKEISQRQHKTGLLSLRQVNVRVTY